MLRPTLESLRQTGRNHPHKYYGVQPTDLKIETDGFTHRITDKMSFRLARAGGANAKFSKAMEAKTRPYRRQIQEDTMDITLANKLLIEAFAETVVLGWEGITTTNGKKIPFTPEAAIKLFTDLPDLFNELREAAGKQSNFRATEVLDDVGN